jgi:hypothetical protein
MTISITGRKIILIYVPFILCSIINFRMKVKKNSQYNKIWNYKLRGFGSRTIHVDIVVQSSASGLALHRTPLAPSSYSRSYMPCMSHNLIHSLTTDGGQCRSEVGNLIGPASILEYSNNLILGRWGSPDAWWSLRYVSNFCPGFTYLHLLRGNKNWTVRVWIMATFTIDYWSFVK